jgi:Calcineurin-like phosphoesterase
VAGTLVNRPGQGTSATIQLLNQVVLWFLPFAQKEIPMSTPYTYPDPTLSLWQASVAEVHRRRKSVRDRMAPAATRQIAAPAMDAEDDLMSPVHLLGDSISKGQSPGALFAPAAAAPQAMQAAVAVPVNCAKTAAQFLWAEMSGDHQKSQVLAGELKYSACDLTGWGECVTTYLAYKASLGNNPYRPNKNVVIDLGAKTKLAILGDWGTGDAVAINLLQQVATLQPDVLIHVGDVYYAGTQNEAHANFLDICRTILGNNIPLFSLCGNHDMYSGGTGYYWLVDQIGQQASYFCLQNADWQFLAMDTGNNDNNPATVSTNMTSLPIQGAWSEANWHLDKIQNAGARKTVLFSHHQLFSPFGPVGKQNNQNYAYNPNLFGNFQTVLPKIDWWFWGHEHTLAIFNPYMGLQRGRCVGASAVPVFTGQQKYATATGLQTYLNGPMPVWNPNGVLGDNGTDYNNCFAIMTLTGASANVDYYQVPILGTASRLNITDAS